ncbi:MAG TPA: hypothetical protein DEQ77_00585, partial [Candidatus Omnitrophica bacterium]|nr:hypothetical protein [Candidatus Omnitrophota bacterium]
PSDSKNPSEIRFDLREMSLADTSIPTKKIQKQILDKLQDWGVLDLEPFSKHNFILNIHDQFKLKISRAIFDRLFDLAKAGKLPTNLDIQNLPEEKAKTSRRSFDLPVGTKWEDILIKFRNEHEVDIFVENVKEVIRTDFSEMGFLNPKNRRPVKEWALLVLLARCNGKLSWENYYKANNTGSRKLEQEYDNDSREGDDLPRNRGYSEKRMPNAIKKTKQMLAQRLKTTFAIAGYPFFPYKEAKAYKTRFGVSYL